jgi:hypothetical protein
VFNSELQAGIAVLAQTKESVASGGDWFQCFLVPIVAGVLVLSRG